MTNVVVPSFSDSYLSDSPLSDSSSVSAASHSIKCISSISLPENMPDEEDNSDAFLLEAMICSICFMVFNEPKQLQCGHSFCTNCVDQLCNEIEHDYVCPLCRAHLTNPPVTNYSLKSLISRIKERNAMVQCCYECSRSAKPEDQYCCDDCDHIDRVERVRCGLCVINGHAKMGHAVSKCGESKELVKTAQKTLQEMISETVQLVKECRNLVTGRLNCVDNLFKLLDEQYAQFSVLEAALNTNGFISKRDIEIKLEHARQLHGIYMRSVSEFAGLMNIMFNEITALTERTGVDLAGHAVYGERLHTKQPIAEPAHTQTQSWFEYQRTGRFSALCSAIARRSAAMAKIKVRSN